MMKIMIIDGDMFIEGVFAPSIEIDGVEVRSRGQKLWSIRDLKKSQMKGRDGTIRNFESFEWGKQIPFKVISHRKANMLCGDFTPARTEVEI